MRRFLDPCLEHHLIKIQLKIASRVVLQDLFSEDIIVGVDQAFLGDIVISGAVGLDSHMRIRDVANCAYIAHFPYIPGFLSFREGISAIKAIMSLRNRPTLLFVDGCGINHPRQAGLASFIGVILGIPTIGISKNVLCGRFDVPKRVGEASPLIVMEKTIGYVLKSMKGCRPIVVAPGHMVSVDTSLEVSQKFLRNRKLPEPCWLAHDYARTIRDSLRPPM
jgi:deoxyribonuclease V